MARIAEDFGSMLKAIPGRMFFGLICRLRNLLSGNRAEPIFPDISFIDKRFLELKSSAFSRWRAWLACVHLSSHAAHWQISICACGASSCGRTCVFAHAHVAMKFLSSSRILSHIFSIFLLSCNIAFFSLSLH